MKRLTARLVKDKRGDRDGKGDDAARRADARVVSVGCSLTGWSAVASASADGTLAAVLAGFMISGIVLLLSFKPKSMGSRYIQALSLMFAAFIVLGLDAFLFGLVTGDSTAVIGKVSACRRTWTEAMFAAGLLGIGAVAIVVGFVLLFDAYFSNGAQRGPDPEWKASLDMLETLCNAIRGGVAVATIDLLYLTARSYLLAIFNGKVPILGTAVFLHGYLYIGILAVLVVTIAALTRHKWPNRFSEWLVTEDRKHFVKTLKIAIYSSVGYAVISVLATAATASWPARDWNPRYPWVRATIAGTVVWVSMAALVPILLLLARTIPNFASGPGEPAQYDLPGRSASSEASLVHERESQAKPR
jgi:hypothetical protein